MQRWKTSAVFKNSYHCLACFIPNPQSPQAFLGFIQETQHAQGREEDLVRHNSPLLFSPSTTTTFSSQTTQLFVWAHTNTLLFIMLIWHCQSWEGETAVLVWPWAHPSLVPASLHSIPPPPSPPWFHISLSLFVFNIVSKTTLYPFVKLADLNSVNPPTCPPYQKHVHVGGIPSLLALINITKTSKTVA